MAEKLSDSHGPAIDAVMSGDDVKIIAVYTDKSMADVLESLTGLTEAFGKMAKMGELANRALLEMNPALISLSTEPAFMPRKLKKAYWKIFENRRITWRERKRLDLWCKRGNTTLNKLSGKQVTA